MRFNRGAHLFCNVLCSKNGMQINKNRKILKMFGKIINFTK